MKGPLTWKVCKKWNSDTWRRHGTPPRDAERERIPLEEVHQHGVSGLVHR